MFVNGTGLLPGPTGVYVTGRPIFVWPVADTAQQDSIFGLFVSPQGQATLLGRPHRDRRPEHVRLHRSSQGVSSLFFEADPAVAATRDGRVSGMLWTGTWRSGTWRDVTPVGPVEGARLAAHEASGLIGDAPQATFVYGFEHQAVGTTPRAGIVRLTNAGATWRADTLPLQHELTYATAIAQDRGRLLIPFVQPDTNESGRPRRSQLWVTEWDGAFSTPQQLTHLRQGESAIRPAAIPLSGTQTLFAWQNNARIVFISRAERQAGRFVMGAPAPLGPASGYTVLTLSPGRVVFFLARPDLRVLQAFLVDKDGARAIGDLPSGDAILLPVVAAAGGDAFLHLALSLTPDRGETLAIAELVHLRIACH